MTGEYQSGYDAGTRAGWWLAGGRRTLKPCPFCGGDAVPEALIYPMLANGEWVITHYCDDGRGGFRLAVNVNGRTLEECVKNWNTRAGSAEDTEGENEDAE